MREQLTKKELIIRGLRVVLQTNPPAWRTVQLAELSEAHGFDYVWTFDSHLLWQEPYVIYSQILACTNRVMVGPMVTNPATRDWTVTASLFATLNEMFGNRTICGIGRGDSAVRVTNGRPTTVREMREATHVIRELANCRPVEYKGSTCSSHGHVPQRWRSGWRRTGQWPCGPPVRLATATSCNSPMSTSQSG
jgi:alkanesulfonate monooxygenase SsuD/methylene tetrahydromethanopterin reductase-like flavin-dependent oxidoreductase (luciferase family)